MRLLFFITLFFLNFSMAEELNSKNYIFALIETEGNYQIHVHHLELWENEGKSLFVFKNENEEEYISSLMSLADLCNGGNAIYEPCDTVYSKEEMIPFLQNLGFSYNSDFENWLRNH
jgi:hypothetical protein